MKINLLIILILINFVKSNNSVNSNFINSNSVNYFMAPHNVPIKDRFKGLNHGLIKGPIMVVTQVGRQSLYDKKSF